mmetsp:Transcript_14276/g.20748  ORF Transcript_14276/g.20748 Transcript_14276/m.20748 type:complete len:217 (-) Transcript_14276:670-1320(-)
MAAERILGAAPHRHGVQIALDALHVEHVSRTPRVHANGHLEHEGAAALLTIHVPRVGVEVENALRCRTAATIEGHQQLEGIPVGTEGKLLVEACVSEFFAPVVRVPRDTRVREATHHKRINLALGIKVLPKQTTATQTLVFEAAGAACECALVLQTRTGDSGRALPEITCKSFFAVNAVVEWVVPVPRLPLRLHLVLGQSREKLRGAEHQNLPGSR